jgi:hypothetical protein
MADKYTLQLSQEELRLLSATVMNATQAPFDDNDPEQAELKVRLVILAAKLWSELGPKSSAMQ